MPRDRGTRDPRRSAPEQVRSAVPEAEFALLVSDRFQGLGLGTLLLSRLLQVGRAEGLRRITAEILLDNSPMQRIWKELGFHLRRDIEEMVVKADSTLFS